MPGLAWAKRRVAVRLNSVSLRADAAETQLCTYLSAVVLLGLVSQRSVRVVVDGSCRGTRGRWPGGARRARGMDKRRALRMLISACRYASISNPVLLTNLLSEVTGADYESLTPHPNIRNMLICFNRYR